MFYFWLLLSGCFLILELVSMSFFYCLSCTVGFFVAAISSFYCNSLIVQSALGTGVSLISFWALRAMLKKYNFFLPKHPQRTNIYNLIGKEGVVVHSIRLHEMGQVKVEAQLWAARSCDESSIATEQSIEVVGFKGCHLIVRKSCK